MKYLKYLFLSVFILSLLILSVSAGDNQSFDGLNITDNVTQAFDDAKLQNKSVMLIFSQDNCYYCDLFEQDVLSNEDVQKVLNEDYIVADVDIIKNSFDSSKYQVFGTPTTIIADSNGDEVYRIEGYVSADQFLEELKEI